LSKIYSLSIIFQKNYENIHNTNEIPYSGGKGKIKEEVEEVTKWRNEEECVLCCNGVIFGRKVSV